MKRLAALVLALGLAVLAGCAGSPAAGGDPAWQAELAGGGTLAVSGCTVSEETAQLLAGADGAAVSLPLLRITGDRAPELTFAGVAESDIAFSYIEPEGEVWVPYAQYIPVEKLDYILTRAEDGTLCYRLDTVYGYCVTVGQEQWLLAVSRDGI